MHVLRSLTAARSMMSLTGAAPCIHSPWPQWGEDALCHAETFQSSASEDEMRLSLGHLLAFLLLQSF